jgi:hypothetical protein
MIEDLPTHDVDELRARRIRTAALAELAHAREDAGWRGTFRRGWRRAELVVVAVAAAGYLFWALRAATLAYR